jgi:5-methylcytosine-specific restriction endonuclease McrA
MANESTTQYAERIKKGFNAPFTCFFCRRIKTHDYRMSFDQEYQEKLLERNLRIEQNIKKREEIRQFKKQIRQSSGFVEHTERFKKEIKKKSKALNGMRAHRFKQALIQIEEDEKAAIKRFYENTPAGHDVDHIIPISKGGKHILNNLQYMPSKENVAKGGRIKPEIISKFANGETISIPWLQRFFKLDFDEAKRILQAF